ncbi:MAG: sigma-70 family RNA polymerase sigma factor [Acidobacteria bacterium]|nr:sigma-70 family RNA polymerase sigma factor [Acidobacteriota bacterium]MBI3658153.1 sigma-70 family RNA polymerase sigma factor [Acidobacteriota bacterium]
MKSEKNARESMTEDEALVHRFLAGETEAFSQLVRNWQRPIYNFIYRFVGEREEARDISQEVFTTVFRKVRELREKSRFSAWIYKIALNQCRLRRRELKGKTTVPLDASPENTATAIGRFDPPDRKPGPEEQLSREEVALAVRTALETLPSNQRDVIVMKEYQGLKFHEIAEVLDCPISTIKSRMYFGLQALEKELRRRRVVRAPEPGDLRS